jgi:tetratricopeptide (TPR) repeat protein
MDAVLALETQGLSFLATDPERAAELFAQAVEQAPRSYDAHRYRGMALERLGRLEEAITSFRRAEAIITDDPWIHMELARIYERRQRYGEAVDEYRAVVAIAPRTSAAWAGLARSSGALGRTSSTSRAVRRLVRLHRRH